MFKMDKNKLNYRYNADLSDVSRQDIVLRE